MINQPKPSDAIAELKRLVDEAPAEGLATYGLEVPRVIDMLDRLEDLVSGPYGPQEWAPLPRCGTETKAEVWEPPPGWLPEEDRFCDICQKVTPQEHLMDPEQFVCHHN